MSEQSCYRNKESLACLFVIIAEFATGGDIEYKSSLGEKWLHSSCLDKLGFSGEPGRYRLAREEVGNEPEPQSERVIDL